MTGGPASTVRVKSCSVWLVAASVAVIWIGYVPAVVNAGVPERVAVSSPLSTKVTPVGSAPDSTNEIGLSPVVVTVKLPDWFSVNEVEAALVKFGPPPSAPAAPSTTATGATASATTASPANSRFLRVLMTLLRWLSMDGSPFVGQVDVRARRSATTQPGPPP